MCEMFGREIYQSLLHWSSLSLELYLVRYMLTCKDAKVFNRSLTGLITTVLINRTKILTTMFVSVELCYVYIIPVLAWKIQLFHDVYCIALRKTISKVPLKVKKKWGNIMVSAWLMSSAVKVWQGCLISVHSENALLTNEMTPRSQMRRNFTHSYFLILSNVYLYVSWSITGVLSHFFLNWVILKDSSSWRSIMSSNNSLLCMQYRNSKKPWLPCL